MPTFVALCLGALVGLERQVAQSESQGEKDFPGVRTFAFTGLLGALAVMVANAVHPLLAVAIFAADAVFLVLRYRFDAEQNADPGYTTETASLCTFAVGALAQSGELLVATVVTIAMVVLLRSKRTLHRAAHLLSPADMEALIRFLVITGIVLPLLPDTPIDPMFQVLRPRDVWRMVVLISGLSFVAYVLMRVRAGQASYLITGLLAGMVSSTAATLAYARAGRGVAHARHYEALVALATSTGFVRVGLMLFLVAPELARRVFWPLAAMTAVSLALSFARHQPEQNAPERHKFENPLTMRVAITFAAIYASVTLLLAYARQELGEAGIYAVSGAAALVGADSPSLSLARLAHDGHIALETATLAIVVIAIFTTVGKVGVLAMYPSPFARRVATSLMVVAATGALMLLMLRRLA
ncbi:MAG TPA: MgtC/SapB family protein [Myxococcota bacterium]|nr:MgtC/SapB family protein [Myxococcota bacterium]